MICDVLGICLLDLSGKGSRDDTHQYRSVLYDEKVVKSISRIRGMTDVLMRIVLEKERFRKFQHDFVQSTESHSIDDLLFVQRKRRLELHNSFLQDTKRKRHDDSVSIKDLTLSGLNTNTIVRELSHTVNILIVPVFERWCQSFRNFRVCV